MRLEQALQRYLLHLDADGRSVHTRNQYARHLRLLANWFGDDRDVEAIEPTDLARFLTSPMAKLSCRGGEKRATSLNSLRTSLHVFFSYHHAAGLITHNAARQVRRAICGSPPPRALSDDEVRTLLATIASIDTPVARRDHALFHLLVASGARLASALALDVGDIDLRAGVARLRCTKGDREQRLFLSSELRIHLDKFLTERPQGAVFVGSQGVRLGARQAQRRLEMWGRHAAIERRVSPHQLRHSFAVAIYRRTHDLFALQRLLGHTSIVSTTVYARADDARLREVIGT